MWSVKWFGPVGKTGRVWLVTNHPLGPKRCGTWQEAMDYANTQPMMMNATTVRLWDRHEVRQ